MSFTKPLILLGLTTIAKIGFGIFFTSGSAFHHTNQWDEALDFCSNIGKDSLSELVFCYFDFKGGLLLTGAILFFTSILLEAFGPNKILIGWTTVPTIFHALGSLLLAIVILYPILCVRECLDDYDIHCEGGLCVDPDFEGVLWMAGGLITGFGQAHLAYMLRSKGFYVVVTYFFANLGSFIFMVAGTMMLKVVAEDFQNELEYLDMIADLMISGSVLYIVHGILYPIATYTKIKDLTTNQENPAVTVTNPNVYNNEREKPDGVGGEEEC